MKANKPIPPQERMTTRNARKGSPWFRSPACDTHNARKSFVRYAARGKRPA